MLITSDLRDYWLVRLLGVLALIKSVSSQGLACYKCMTTDPRADSCQDPFSSLLNPIQINCQATAKDKDGTFPARYCVKISGRVMSVDNDANASYLHTNIYYRTCVVNNIMDSSKSLETTGNFRLRGLQGMNGTIRVQGFMSLCTMDGCNAASRLPSSLSFSTLIIALFMQRRLCHP